MKLDISSIKFLNKISIPNRLTVELAKEIGLHIGDGSMNFYNTKSGVRGSYSLLGHLYDDRQHYDKIIKNLYKDLYDLNLSLREMSSTGVYGFQKLSNDLVTFKSKVFGLPLGKKTNIVIPRQIISKNNFLAGVIKGIFDTDGTLYLQPKYEKLYPCIEISTTSETLGMQLNRAINNLGFRSTVYSGSKIHPNWNILYKVSIRGELMLNNWMKIIEPHNPKHWKKYQYFINKM